MIVVAVIAVVGLVGAVAVLRDEPEPVTRARALVAGGDWDTAEGAGQTLAEVAERLITAARRCRSDHGDRGDCRALAAAAGYAEVLAVAVLRCTAPGRFEARQAIGAVLDSLEDLRPDAPPLTTPGVPRCP